MCRNTPSVAVVVVSLGSLRKICFGNIAAVAPTPISIRCCCCCPFKDTNFVSGHQPSRAALFLSGGKVLSVELAVAAAACSTTTLLQFPCSLCASRSLLEIHSYNRARCSGGSKRVAMMTPRTNHVRTLRIQLTRTRTHTGCGSCVNHRESVYKIVLASLHGRGASFPLFQLRGSSVRCVCFCNSPKTSTSCVARIQLLRFGGLLS